MKTTKIIFGTSTGTCESIANTIAEKLELDASSVINVTDLTLDIINNSENLILGTSTWGSGDMQDDWFDGIELLKDSDLKDKTIALFGCGDSESFSDTFCGGMGQIYTQLEDSGATFIGMVSTEGYNFEESPSVIDNKFVGLAIDDVNQSDLTDERITNWIEVIKSSL